MGSYLPLTLTLSPKEGEGILDYGNNSSPVGDQSSGRS